VRQNAAHMRAVRRVIDGASVPVRRWPFRAAAREGLGAGCGTPHPTGGGAALQRRGGVKLEAAWSRLVAAAADGGAHRAAHATRRPAGADGMPR